MASSCSTSLFAPSFPIKIVPYIPRAPTPKPKPKPKSKAESKAESKAITKMAEYSRGVGSSKDIKCNDDYRTPAGNDGSYAGQHGDLDAAGARAFSADDIESIHYNRSPAEDESRFGDVGVTDGPSAIRKRTRPSIMTISPAVALDVTLESALEDPRSSKRRRLAERQVENLILSPVATPKSTALPTPSGDVSRSRASNEPSLGPLDSDNERDGARTSRPSPSDLHDEEDGGDSAQGRSTGEELLHSLRGSISPSEKIEGEQDIGSDSERREEHREGGDGDVGESYEDERN
ncbi:hypothetical protein BU23DRAFT_562539 [Bimuria novae-zelandiae CBS 107.79]|uniref:Uncharacterized protein n=1 Tax=Bimuria novae-zelandiae CBS 107.79 TaxID=1447943 RepID=A0A6A5VTP6_9PLEO|nr:hypothetical protein BU23DRAFT_562539 [Bimuria novae-zelandiae CBS 107.79]